MDSRSRKGCMVPDNRSRKRLGSGQKRKKRALFLTIEEEKNLVLDNRRRKRSGSGQYN